MDFLKDSQKDVEVAKTMVKNRLATDLNDAIRQIQRRREAEKEMMQNSRTSEKPADANKVTSTGTTPSIAAKDGSGRMKEIESFLQRFDKFFSKFYNDTQLRLSEMAKDICAMKEQIKGLKLYARGGQSSKQQADVGVAEKKQEAKPDSGCGNKQEKKQGSSNSGEYTPDDVSIENIFSNAHGKMMKKK